jgi:glycosyltransferase involved in cell wall biosynthesis
MKKIYNGIIYDNMSLRNSTINIDENISNQEISKLIENNNKSFVFIIPSYNNANLYKSNLDSVFNQKYPFWRIIYIDDASTDDTKTLVKDYVNEKGFQHKFQIIEKKENTGQAHSRSLAFKECHNDEICCMLDGDDALVNNEMLLYKLNKLYIENNLLISYGQFYYVENNKILNISGLSKYTQEEIENNNYRTRWVTQHLRTCEASLLKQIPDEYLKLEGEWLRCCTDVAEMWFVLEKSNGRHMNTGFPTYLYNKSASMNSNYSYYNRNDMKYVKEKEYRARVQKYLLAYKQSDKEVDLDYSAATTSANVVEINLPVNYNCEELLQFFQKAQENLSSALSYAENISLTKNVTEKEKIKTILLDNQLNLITHTGIITNMLKKIQ